MSQYQDNDYKNQGFTLVELSIVLVILGLLVGGVLTGQSLIRAAELRSVVTDYNTFITATNSFRDKYFGLPGDLTNATSFWGTAAAGASCATTVGAGTATCNGNGDGAYSHPAVTAGLNAIEMFRYWQHLANAGLVAGTYTGVTDGSNNWSATAANSAKSKINGALWMPWSLGAVSGRPDLFTGQYDNYFAMAGVTANADPQTTIFKPEEAWNIDTKVDDGKPATGKLVMRGNMALCTDTSTNTNMAASYLLNNTGQVCSLIFRQIF